MTDKTLEGELFEGTEDLITELVETTLPDLQAGVEAVGEKLDLDKDGKAYGPPRIDRVPNRAMRRDNQRLKGIRRSLRSRIQRKRGRHNR